MTDQTCPCCGQEMKADGLVIDFVSDTITYHGKVAALTKSEMKIFSLLYRAYPRMLTREHMFDALYPQKVVTSQKILDVFICKLRQRLKNLDLIIATHWGRGYALQKAHDLDREVAEARMPAGKRVDPKLDEKVKDLASRNYSEQQIAAQLRIPYTSIIKAMARLNLRGEAA
jgi:DNA-binding winged helix-turn-helix (wHTH) protein